MNAISTATHCIHCGEPASLASVIPTLGRCPKCYARFTRDRDPKSQIPTDALVVAGFHPGFAEDLTSWETQITAEGSLRQTIRWYEYAHGRRAPESRTAKLNDDCVLNIVALIQEIDRLGIAKLNQHFCIDDVERVYIIAPDIGFHASIAPYTFQHFAAREPIAERAITGLKTFRAAWDSIEAISPYTTSMHWKRANNEVNPSGGSGGF